MARWRLVGFLIALLLINPAWTVYAASDQDMRRARIGIRLFRTALASDIQLAQKLGAQQQVPLVVLHRDDPEAAQEAAETLRTSGQGASKGQIVGWPVDVKVMPVAEFLLADEQTPAGIFLLQDLSDEQLQPLIRYSRERQIILYSSVEGHVERGVLAGIDVGVRVLPYINMPTLAASGLQIKALFLKVAKHYD